MTTCSSKNFFSKIFELGTSKVIKRVFNEKSSKYLGQHKICLLGYFFSIFQNELSKRCITPAQKNLWSLISNIFSNNCYFGNRILLERIWKALSWLADKFYYFLKVWKFALPWQAGKTSYCLLFNDPCFFWVGVSI